MTNRHIQGNGIWTMALVFCAVAILPTASHAAITIPGADGSDGELHITEDTHINLGLAATGNWDAPSPVAGQGVYDQEKWAVVFKYTNVTIDAGATLTFSNHPANPPVVWLVSATVHISGTVSLEGDDPSFSASIVILNGAEGGPGAFRGSLGTGKNVWGLGIEGGKSWYPIGTYAKAGEDGSFNYSNSQIIPLVGGSGGNGGEDSRSGFSGGGGGGGAILIASAETVTISGIVSTTGGGAHQWIDGDGAAGAIRIICDTFSGSPTLTATRKRIEANNVDMITAPASIALPSDPPKIWLADTDPKLTVVSVDGNPLPTDPRAQLELTATDGVVNGDLAEHEIILQGENIPVCATVDVRGAYVGGNGFNATATFQSGDETLSTWVATVSLDKARVLAIQARAHSFDCAER